MKKIVISEIRLLNFKGIRELSVIFDPSVTNIYGRNGSGKTTIFDAFTWLLFGKDSSDRKDFNIKTLDERGQVIEKLPHEVQATILVNDTVCTLKKCYIEKWVKKRGSITEEFSGHTTEQYINDVPCGPTEYAKKIADMFTSEDMFKLITSPTYFLSQSKDFKRDMLFQMAGDVTNEEVASLKPEFAELLDSLTGKSLDEFKRELAAKKKRIKTDMENIPARIDERKRDMPEAENWSEIETDLQNKLAELTSIEETILDSSKAYNAVVESRKAVAKELSEYESKKVLRESEIKIEVEREYSQQVSERKVLLAKADELERNKVSVLKEKNTKASELIELQAKRETLLNEFYAIRDGKLPVFNDSEFVCPTCHRPLEASDIEAKKAEMRNNMSEENKRKGLKTKNEIEQCKAKISEFENTLFSIDEELAQIKATDLYQNEPKRPSADLELSTDKVLLNINNKITDLRNQLNDEVTAPDNSELQGKKRTCESEIATIRERLSKKAIIEANNKRINELEDNYKAMSDELTELEGKEFVVTEFGKAKIEQVENRINGLFKIVKWKMFKQQINGGEVETCDAMVDGVPYSDLNTAGKINAGLDIINAFTEKMEISAPVFIDNRESVTDIEQLSCQIINLIVNGDYNTVTII